MAVVGELRQYESGHDQSNQNKSCVENQPWVPRQQPAQELLQLAVCRRGAPAIPVTQFNDEPGLTSGRVPRKSKMSTGATVGFLRGTPRTALLPLHHWDFV